MKVGTVRTKSSADSVSWFAPEPGPGPGRVAVAIRPSGWPVEKKKELHRAEEANKATDIRPMATRVSCCGIGGERIDLRHFGFFGHCTRPIVISFSIIVSIFVLISRVTAALRDMDSELGPIMARSCCRD